MGVAGDLANEAERLILDALKRAGLDEAAARKELDAIAAQISARFGGAGKPGA